MTPVEHMLMAEAQLLMADMGVKPGDVPQEGSAHLHTSMFHLEAAIAIAGGRSVTLPELVKSDD